MWEAFWFFVEDRNLIFFIDLKFQFCGLYCVVFLSFLFRNIIEISTFSWATQTFIFCIFLHIKIFESMLFLTLEMILNYSMTYPSFTWVTADPFSKIFFFILIAVYLFTKLTKKIVVITLIATFAEETIFSRLNPWSNFPINFFRWALLIEAFFAGRYWKLISLILSAFSYFLTAVWSMIFSLLIFWPYFLFLSVQVL